MSDEYPNAPPWIYEMLAESEFMKAHREFLDDERRRMDEAREICRAYNHGHVGLPDSTVEVHHFDNRGLDQGKCEVMSPRLPKTTEGEASESVSEVRR